MIIVVFLLVLFVMSIDVLKEIFDIVLIIIGVVSVVISGFFYYVVYYYVLKSEQFVLFLL